jgi:SAM-dependent methyltransferase
MLAQIFDRLWIESWRADLAGRSPIRAAELIVKLADLHSTSTLIDFGCGTGRIAHALTQFGIHVTGIERSAEALSEARRVDNPLCRFLSADWCDYDPDPAFDCAIFWFTTLCAGPESDSEALSIARRALGPDGTLLIETRHWDRVPRRFDARTRRDSDNCTLIEKHSYDPDSRIQTTKERYFLPKRIVSRTYQTRRYGIQELRNMCLQVGFAHVDAFDEEGQPLSTDSERMILRAQGRGGTR